MVAYFQLQPAEAELQQLAEEYWQKAGEKEHELERAAFEAGEAIRNGDYTLTNLEAIVRWKSERVVQYLIGNSDERDPARTNCRRLARVFDRSRRKGAARSARRGYSRGLGCSGRDFSRALHSSGFPRPRSAGPRASRRALLPGVSGLLQATGRKQHREAARRPACSHAAAHTRPCAMGVVAQPRRVARRSLVPPAYHPMDSSTSTGW